MKAAILKGKKDLYLEEYTISKLNSNEILINVKSCGICGTDRHIYEGKAPSALPIILGHEFAGIVAENNTSKEFLINDKVVIDPNIFCGVCSYCREGNPHFCENFKAIGVTQNGGFAEYAIVPKEQIYKIPEEMDFETAVFTEPVSCCLRGMDHAEISPGNNVIIIGGGSIGQIMLQLAKISGAVNIIMIEPEDDKRDKALINGATVCLSPNDNDIFEHIADLTYRKIDVIIECAGNETAAKLSLKLSGKGSRIVIFGLSPKDSKLNIDLQELFLQEVSIHFSYLNPYKFPKAIELLAKRKIEVKDLISAKFSLLNIHEVFSQLLNSHFIKYQIINTNREAA